MDAQGTHAKTCKHMHAQGTQHEALSFCTSDAAFFSCSFMHKLRVFAPHCVNRDHICPFWGWRGLLDSELQSLYSAGVLQQVSGSLGEVLTRCGQAGQGNYPFWDLYGGP